MSVKDEQWPTMLMGKLLALPQQQLPGESDRFQEGTY
jgi:hypothetical protein